MICQIIQKKSTFTIFTPLEKEKMKKLSRVFGIKKKAKNEKKRRSLDQHVKEYVKDPGDKFKNIIFIAKGSFGKVYSATEKKTGKVVALKRISIANALRDRLTKEIESMKLVRITFYVFIVFPTHFAPFFFPIFKKKKV